MEIDWKKKAKEFLIITIGCFLMGIGFNVFLRSNELVTGGISGLSIVVEYLFNIKASLFIFISNVLLFLIGWYYMGREFAGKTLIGTFMFPLAVDLTAGLPSITNNLLLAALYGSFTIAVGLGFIFKVGGSTGGADIPPQIFNKKFHISVGTGIFIIDGIVVLLGAYIFGMENALYAIVALGVSSFVIDKVLLGFSSTKAIHIISDHHEQIREFIISEVDRGVTILQAEGGYTKQERKVLMVIVENREYTRLKKMITELDPKAFLIVTNATEVHGEGFYK